ncbi:Gfo/Idh/MocA family protein [Alkaliphilus crotonatoxidans]
MIRFGVIGTNKISDEFIKSAGVFKEFVLNAVYSRTEERAREFAGKYSVENIFTDLEAMAKSDLIDAVYIASPNSLHAEQSILFLNNKKHVLCEKAVASNTKELNEMLEAARKNNVLLMEAMKSIFMPNFESIRENLYKIGKVRRYFGSYCQYSSRYDLYKSGKTPNTFNPQFSNGSLMDIGIYCLYPAIYLFGKPNMIQANGVMLKSGVDGEGSISLKYEDMDAVMMHSKITNSSLPSEIQGEKGNIIIDKIHTPENVKIIYRDGTEEEISVPQSQAPMSYEIKEFLQLIKERKLESTINTHELTMTVMQVLETARKQMGLIYPADSIL